MNCNILLNNEVDHYRSLFDVFVYYRGTELLHRTDGPAYTYNHPGRRHKGKFIENPRYVEEYYEDGMWLKEKGKG